MISRPPTHRPLLADRVLFALLVSSRLAYVFLIVVPSSSSAAKALMVAQSPSAYAAITSASVSMGGVHVPTACAVGWLCLEIALVVLFSVPFSLVGLMSGSRLVDVRTGRAPRWNDRVLWWTGHHVYVTCLSPMFSAGMFINDSFDPFSNFLAALMRGPMLSTFPAVNQRLFAPAQTSTDSVAGVLVVNERAGGDLKALAASGFSPRIDLEDD